MAVFYNISSLSEDPSGIKVIENPTKTLKAVLFPRDYLPEFNKMTEANQAGVYILYNTIDRNEQPHIYIGQTGYNITSRLSNHNRNKDFWNQALVFVEKGDFLNLNSAHAKIIESILIDEAVKCGAVVMDNSTGSKAPRVQKADQLASATWADEVMTITKILGLAFFVPQNIEGVSDTEAAPSVQDLPRGEWTMLPDGLYTMSRKNKHTGSVYRGIMEVKNGNCILKTGSKLCPVLRKGIGKGWADKWKNAVKSDDTLLEDIPMDSPSGCAALVTGGSANGWTSWKNTDGAFIDIYRKAED